MAGKLHRCQQCGKRRVNVTVVDGRDLCPACRLLAESEDGQMDFFSDWPVVDYPTRHIGPPDGLTIEEAFKRFHAENPQVAAELAEISLSLVRGGSQRLSINRLFEVLRHNRELLTGGDEFKLNNNYRSYYSRLLMSKHPELNGKFETRELHAPKREGGKDGSD